MRSVLLVTDLLIATSKAIIIYTLATLLVGNTLLAAGALLVATTFLLIGARQETCALCFPAIVLLQKVAKKNCLGHVAAISGSQG